MPYLSLKFNYFNLFYFFNQSGFISFNIQSRQLTNDLSIMIYF